MSLSPRYENVLATVDETPRTATRLYRRWAELPEWKALTRRHRNERRWFATALENLANEGTIHRGENEGRTCFWRSDDGRTA